MKEYASLGRDIISITFDPSQHLIPEDKLTKALDSAMVDMVNLVGIDINDAVNDNSTANLLPYVCGLGPRKAAHMLKIINSWGGEVNTRDQLVGDVERGQKQAVGPKCWLNCASFLYVQYEATENDTDYLDNTRIHPEDYDIASKIAADALEFDEEDIKNEVDQNGPAAVVRRLVHDEAQDKVNDLLLEEYAGQLEAKFGQKKRATLELIRAELQNPFEELRRNFEYLSSNETFTMMTGETETSLQEGMIIPVSVKRTSSDHIEVKLDCGVDGNISSSEFPDQVTNNQLEPRQVWSIHSTIQAKITHIDRKKLHVQLTMRDNEMKNPFRRQFDHDYGKSLAHGSICLQHIFTNTLQMSGTRTKKPVISVRRSALHRSRLAASSVLSSTRSSALTTHIRPRLNFPSRTSSVVTASSVLLPRVRIILQSLGRFTTMSTSTSTSWSSTRRTSTALAAPYVWANSATAIWTN